MIDAGTVSNHYRHGNLLEAIRQGLEKLGKTPETVTLHDLSAVDEFHIGGRQASAEFLDQLAFAPDQSLLDIGCGLGGSARFVADRYGSHVTGIDLTEEYVETGKALCGWLGLEERIFLQQGSAVNLPFGDVAFDGAYMMHVGMNIADKATLCAEVHRVLRPGAVFGIYDVMRFAEGELAYPVPWSTTPAHSFVASPQAYKEALIAAGFTIVAERNRRDFALAFFARQRARVEAEGRPPLSLHVVMGDNMAAKLTNLVASIAAGMIAPVEIIARKAA
jgi:SAM-dependent methyltransferase